MALIGGIGVFFVSILAATLSRILAEEIDSWSPSIIHGLIKFAVGRLPENQRERYEEEWQSHINDVPGQIGKLLVAAGFSIAAFDFSLTDHRDRMFDNLVGVLTQVDDAIIVSTKLINEIQNDETLASLQEVSSLDKRWAAVQRINASLKRAKSFLTESQNQRDLMAHIVVLDSVAPKNMIGNLLCLLVERLSLRKSRGHISQSARQITERSSEVLKLMEERARK
jgi:hypothetical protein